MSKPSKKNATSKAPAAKVRKVAAATSLAPMRRNITKQAKLIAMLRTPEGATIAKIAKALGWQPHTVRGVFSGALKKKLGLTVTSEKTESGARFYRIA